MVSFWCHDPGIGFRYLQQFSPRNIILTSGTLTPFKYFESELKTNFKVQLVNNHIIDIKSQCLSVILKKGINNSPIQLSYENRDNEASIKDLGNCLVNFSRVIPNGMLIFFSSYAVMNRCLEVWATSLGIEKTIIERLEEHKKTFQEPKTSELMRGVLADYAKCAKGNGAILFTVCKGKFSEDIDFADELARAVFVVGVPYPSLVDRR